MIKSGCNAPVSYTHLDVYKRQGTVKRIEIGVMPALMNSDEVQIALNAPSRTFDLAANAFDDGFYSPIAVSYTHLDVYKRQPVDRSAIRRQNLLPRPRR